MWFDRDLTIAGRVIIWKKRDGGVSYAHNEQRRYTGIGYPPTLAIHLDRLVKKILLLSISSVLLFVIMQILHDEGVVCYSNTK